MNLNYSSFSWLVFAIEIAALTFCTAKFDQVGRGFFSSELQPVDQNN
jgi:hypothetical protein